MVFLSLLLKGTPWQELNMHHCGWWVDNDVDTLAATIREAGSLRRRKDCNGKTWTTISQRKLFSRNGCPKK